MKFNKTLLVAIVLLVTLIALFHQYIYYLRVPILGIFFLVLFPLISSSPLLRNLFIFRNKLQLALVIPAVVIAGLAVGNIFETILVDGPTRFDFIPPPQGWQWVRDILSADVEDIVEEVLSTDISSYKIIDFLLQNIEPGKDVLAFLLGLPICITAIHRSRKDSQIRRYLNNNNNQTNTKPSWWILLAGFTVLLLFDILTSFIANYIEHSRISLETKLINLINLLPQGGKIGYLTPGGGLTGSHLSNTGFLLVALLFYIVSGIWGCSLLRQQKSRNGQTEEEKFNVPALFYLMFITIGIILFFGGATFLLDYYLIPVLLGFLVVFASIYSLFNVDHYYQLKELCSCKKEKNKIELNENKAIDNFKTALHKRLESQEENNRTLVVVCASGGGIQAAAWMVKVLTGLQEELNKKTEGSQEDPKKEEEEGLGTKFTKAIGLISSVSGGSVGSMYYLDRFGEDGYPKQEEFKDIFKSATANSLDATGWGLAYPDLWRFIGFPWIPEILKLGDRGTAIEMDWKGNLQDPTNPPTLYSWRNEVLKGKIPIPVFNATLVDNGYRFLISPMTFVQQSDEEKKYKDFNSLYGKDNYDIDLTTAARLSATFPYVTPICCNHYPTKQPKEKDYYHVADGGYFDNFGVFTTVEWLDKVVLEKLYKKQNFKLKKIIILQINAFHSSAPENNNTTAESAQTNNNSSKKPGWLMSLAGPLLAVFKVRSSTQTDRNDLEIEILKKKWKHQANFPIEYVKVEFPQINKSDLDAIEKKYSSDGNDENKWNLFLNDEGEYEPPLSWKLSEFEKAMIQYAWEEKVKDEVVEEIERIY
ncbi:MAG: patatin-like phospholipase family protein [Prochloraceae cyanobacterium]|nr:patatin-like phospholipase family protein [Prochloraceae cyanobacterium]